MCIRDSFLYYSGTLGTGQPIVLRTTMLTAGGLLFTSIASPAAYTQAFFDPITWPFAIGFAILGILIPTTLINFASPKLTTGMVSIMASSELPVGVFAAWALSLIHIFRVYYKDGVRTSRDLLSSDIYAVDKDTTVTLAEGSVNPNKYCLLYTSSLEVHRERPLDLFIAQFPGVAKIDDARIGHHHIQATKRLPCLSERCFDLRRRVDVRLQRQHLATRIANQLDGLFEDLVLWFEHIDEHYIELCLRKRNRMCAPLAHRAACDQNNLFG